MEEGCILPDNLTQNLSKDSLVITSLTRFCNCTADELFDIFKKRNKSGNYRAYGYHTYRKKTGKKSRILREPDKILKKVQETIKYRLSHIPVSLSATGGKPGDSVEKNTDIHRKNPYLITLDIKDAYPSIHTHRIYKNLQGALLKPLKIWCPQLETDEDKDLFVRAITHLCVTENQLPQGASTSTQLQNMVFAPIDIAIEKKLPELSGSNIVYSRYADDITISFPHFSTMDVLKTQMEYYIQKIRYEFLYEEDDDKSSAVLNDFTRDTFVITDKFEFKYLQHEIEIIKTIIQGTSTIQDNKKEKAIGVLNTFKKNIKYSGRRIRDIEQEIINIIGGEGRKVNMMKTETWTPQSNRDREINGLLFDPQGNRAITAKKKSEYLRLFEDLIKFSINDLFDNTFYRKKFEIEQGNDNCVSSIISTLEGCYHYLTKVYGVGKIPKDLEVEYQRAISKWTMPPEIPESTLGSESHEGNNSPDDTLLF